MKLIFLSSGIRRFTKDKAFKQAVDEYIRSNLQDIMQSKSFFGLTDLQVEVVGKLLSLVVLLVCKNLYHRSFHEVSSICYCGKKFVS